MEIARLKLDLVAVGLDAEVVLQDVTERLEVFLRANIDEGVVVQNRHGSMNSMMNNVHR